VTFTNKAALEMRERVAKMVGKEAKGVLLSTFHSLGARLLREHGTRIGLPKDFAIYPTGDQAQLVKRIIARRCTVSHRGRGHVRRKRSSSNRDWKNRMSTPPAPRARVSRRDDPGEPHRTTTPVLAAVRCTRATRLAARRPAPCDFDDLLLLP
jgi:superfamily I DNA/RNA helicase